MRVSHVPLSLVLALVTTGCGDKSPSTGTNPTVGGDSSGDSDEDSSDEQGQDASGNPTTGSQGTGTTEVMMTSQVGTEGSTAAATGDDGATFIVPPDGGNSGVECNNFAQDCPDGQKCMPYADNGGNAWNATKCVDVQDNPNQAGDECTVDGSAVSGLDSCDLGVMCWDVDPNTQIGVCVALCGGSVEAPTCDTEHSCFVSNDGVLNLCLLTCDPLAQDCPGDDLCIPNPQGQGEFACVLDASGEEGQAFDPCEFINACDPGLFCANPANGSECDSQAIGCCLPFCDLADPGPCPGVQQECLAWYAEGAAPPGLENTGFCGIPM